MDVREKLVEQLRWWSNECDRTNFGCQASELLVAAANYIANGLTVQEWISVAEPSKEYRDEYGELIPFLVCAEGTDYPFRAMYDGKTWGDGIFAIHVKWWMHIPAPPKEKERKDGDGNV